MTVRSIVTNKEKLGEVSEKINDQAKLEQIIQDLKDTAAKYRGTPKGCVGLAAVQIGEPYRVFIVHHEAKWLVFVNPTVEYIKGMSPYMKEGCLSRPSVLKKCRRYKKLKVSYDIPGEDIRVHDKQFTGFTARVIQHEYDHLNGIYI